MNLNSLPLSASRKIDKIFSNSTSKAGIEKESAHFSSIIKYNADKGSLKMILLIDH